MVTSDSVASVAIRLLLYSADCQLEEQACIREVLFVESKPDYGYGLCLVGLWLVG